MSRPRAPLLSILALLLAAACGDPGDGSGDGDGDGDGDRETYELTWGPIDVEPGVEDTRCVVKRLENDTAIKVNEFRNALGATSHHFIVYRVSADTQEQPEPFACNPFFDILDGNPLIVTQKAEDSLLLPEGVGYTLEAGQMVRLEMHYINATDAVQTVEATASFTTIPESDYEHEADFIFAGDLDIEIPANSTGSVPAGGGVTYMQMPPAMQGVNFFAITGHTHQWGTEVFVASSAGPDDPGTPVYEPAAFNWDEPETAMHTPAFQLPDNGGFNLRCAYNNLSDEEVGLGEGANDEMCFFWAYYYPSTGEPRVCAQLDQFGDAVCCPDVSLACAAIDMFN
jgi:hypothetical protein